MWISTRQYNELYDRYNFWKNLSEENSVMLKEAIKLCKRLKEESLENG